MLRQEDVEIKCYENIKSGIFIKHGMQDSTVLRTCINMEWGCES